MVPKIGSTTIVHHFKTLNIPTFYCDHTHLNFKSAKELFQNSITDFDDYTFYAFYRDPIERFKSAIAFKYRNTQLFCLEKVDLILDYYYDKIKKYVAQDYHNEFNIFEGRNESIVDLKEFMKPQVHWLDFDINLKLLSHDNFSDHVVNLVELFGGNSVGEILKINQKRYDIDLSNKHKEKIIDMYSIDYMFLKERGINLL